MPKDFDYQAFEKDISPLSIKVTKISLMKSERISEKLTYTEIYSGNWIRILLKAKPVAERAFTIMIFLSYSKKLYFSFKFSTCI